MCRSPAIRSNAIRQLLADIDCKKGRLRIKLSMSFGCVLRLLINSCWNAKAQTCLGNLSSKNSLRDMSHVLPLKMETGY